MRALVLTLLAGLLGVTSPGAAEAGPPFTSSLRGNIANQSIAGFPASRATWDLERGKVALIPFGEEQAVVVVTTTGLIIPAIGFNPSPDLLARVVCHDAAGTPSEAARTKTVAFPQSGDATLIDVVSIAGDCFAPIVLLTGSRDPDGNTPGNWFAVSGF